MSVSIIDAQREVILRTIRHITKGDWKVLVVDRDSRRLLDNVVDEDAILNENITNIEQITDRRPTNRDVDALYFLTPKEHIIDSLMADFQRRKYRKSHLVWTSLLHPSLRGKIDQSQTARDQIAQFTTLNLEYFPRESHLVTFRDPWSFPILYHQACNHLVRQHMEDIAQKIVGVCVALGEYPTIRYYRPRAPTHESSILCSHLARFVQDELDLYAKFHNDFPPPSSQARPRGALYIVDRSMDLVAPFVHEFTYQAMAHDLLPIKDGEKTTFRVMINEDHSDPEEKEKDIPITEKDRIWTENRHRHMKDVIEKLMADFQKFLKDNPHFASKNREDAVGGRNGLNVIKDMMAGLPQFQEMKEAYALHLGMAQESMNRFQKFKLADISSVEQTCATGLDEDYKKPKHLADAVVRMLDEEGIPPADRLRLLILFLLYNDGLLPADTQKLLAHAQLPPSDMNIISNLEIIGARTTRNLKDSRPRPPPIFPLKPPPLTEGQQDLLISRYEPALQRLLEAHGTNSVDQTTFPYTKPPLDTGDQLRPTLTSTSSLRSAKPTWARTRTAISTENRQRVIVFVAGGATYSESRACYDVGRNTSREAYLVTSHMLTPTLFLRQIADLSADRRRLGIPSDQPKEKAPAHLFESDAPPPPQVPQHGVPQQQQRQPSAVPAHAMANMNINGTGGAPSGPRTGPIQLGTPNQAPAPQANSSAKLTKEEPKKDKKRHKFGFGKG